MLRHSKRLSREVVDASIPGSIQGQIRWGSEQPGLVEGVPAHDRRLGTRGSLSSLPNQAILWFYDLTGELGCPQCFLQSWPYASPEKYIATHCHTKGCPPAQVPIQQKSGHRGEGEMVETWDDLFFFFQQDVAGVLCLMLEHSQVRLYVLEYTWNFYTKKLFTNCITSMYLLIPSHISP